MRLGIIGLGIMGERLLRVALAHPGVEVSGVWDPSDAAAARLEGIAPGMRLAATADEVTQASEAVYVASPPASHIAHGQAVLAAGRALFLEKPLASDVASARAFVASAKGQRAAVNFPMASSPAVAQLMAWMPGVGPLQRIEIAMEFATWPRGWQQGAASWLSKRAEGGFTREVASHFLFLAGRIGGALALQEGRASYPDGDGSEVAVEARLRAGPVPVTLSGRVGGVEADERNLCLLEGERGSIRLRDWSIAERLEDGEWRPAADAVANERMRPVTLGGQLDKLSALTRGEPTKLATLEEALAVQVVVEGMLAG